MYYPIHTLSSRINIPQVVNSTHVPTLVFIKAHWSIPLVVPVDAGMGAVDRDLVVVGTNAMAMCVRVREQTTL
jgi:hypothetical protein